jgi:hypothetical protein
MIFRRVLAVALPILAVIVIPVYGQQVQPPVEMPAIPPHNCVKPELVGSLASQNQIKAFNSSYKAYNQCIKKYVDDAKALADAALAAGNNAVDEFNKVAAAIKAQADAAK